MVNDAEIDALYESTLKPRLAALEGLRSELKGYIVRAGAIVGVPALLLWANPLVAMALPGSLGWMAPIIGFVAVLVGVTVAGIKYLLPGFTAYTNYRVRFKHEVAAEVFKIVCPTARYSPLEGIAETIFDEPGIFRTTGGFKSDDRVRGRIGQTPFEAADVRRSYSTGGKNSRTVVVFSGLFFHLDFNKTLRGVTIVDPKHGAAESIGGRSELREIELESPTFAEAFAVYASDEVEARYILTPAMMERILSLQAQTERPIFLAFKNNRAYLGINYGRALFEPGIAESTSVGALHEMAAHFALAEGIVHELDLNTRIWTKGVDDSLLTVETPGHVDEFDAAAREGNLTAGKIWQAAIKATGGGDEDDGAVVARPASTSIAIEQAGAGVTVNYGFRLGFYVAFLVWAVSLAATLAALRLLPGQLNAPGLTAWVDWIPEIPYTSGIAASMSVPVAIGGTIVGSMAFLMWAVRVRKVEIAPDVIRIWRGLRPVPRTYSRPPYGKIVRMDKAVYVGKVEGLSMINASASPMLSAEEAPWVTAEMRRAIRETAR